MPIFKNLFFGFIISFIGSLPIGYLNIVGYEINRFYGFYTSIFFYLGIIIIEFLIVYLTLIAGNYLSKNKKLMQFIEYFSMFFIFLLGIYFFNLSNSESNTSIDIKNYSNFQIFGLGLLLSSFNFMQIPFWLSWNMVLINKNWIFTEKHFKFFYLVGAVLGTLIGMILFAKLLITFSKSSSFLEQNVYKIIGVFFFFIVFLQLIKLLKKEKNYKKL